MDDLKSLYHEHLLNADLQAQQDFDKAVSTLSGGGLAFSMAFLKDIAGASPIGIQWLASAWILWLASLLTVLASFYASGRAIRKAIAELDQPPKSKAGGHWATFTESLNAVGAALFVAGAICISLFAYKNIPPEKPMTDTKQTPPDEQRGYTPPPAPAPVPSQTQSTTMAPEPSGDKQ